MECTEGHLAISSHSPPTGSRLIERMWTDVNSRTSSHYLISYKSESLTQEFEQDTESEQDRRWRELERLEGLRSFLTRWSWWIRESLSAENDRKMQLYTHWVKVDRWRQRLLDGFLDPLVLTALLTVRLQANFIIAFKLSPFCMVRFQ